MLNWVKNYARVSIEEPHLGRAFFFFLLPFILSLFVAVIIGVSVNFYSAGYNLFLSLLEWVLGAVVLFAIIRLFRGKEASGKFKGVFAGLGFRYFFWFLLLLFAFVVMFLFLPEFFQIVAKAQRAPTTEASLNMLAQGIDTLNSKGALVLFASFGAIILGVVGTIFLTLYLVYEIIAMIGQGTPRQNLLVLLLWALVQGLILFFI